MHHRCSVAVQVQDIFRVRYRKRIGQPLPMNMQRVTIYLSLTQSDYHSHDKNEGDLDRVLLSCPSAHFCSPAKKMERLCGAK
jgi:hypothetical protein